MTIPERRRHPRIPVALPVRTEGNDADGTAWIEIGTSSDASMAGLAVTLEHRVRVGQVLHLSLPLPTRFRMSDRFAPAYRVYALVRTVQAGGRIGVLFLGKNPPRHYEASRSALYFLPGDAGPQVPVERRTGQRQQGVYFFLLKPSADEPGTQQQEATVAENLSRKGLALRTTLPLEKGQVVMVKEVGGSFCERAEVRNISVGADGVTRANLMFLDAEIPERLLGGAGEPDASEPESSEPN